MQIPQSLPQFTNRVALLLITGRHRGRMLLAQDGEIIELETFETAIPKYSDNEGFFEASGHGRIYRSGAVREINQEDIGKKFLKDTVERLERQIREHHVTDVYVFSPREHELESKLPKPSLELIRGTFIGSYLHALMLDLLSSIHARESERIVKPMSEEARNILKKSDID